MNKHLTLLALLTALSAIGLVSAHCVIGSTQAGVVLTETTLAGEPAAAKGLTVHTRSDYEGQLTWDTMLSPGQSPQTVFSFTPQRTPVQFKDYGLDISTPFPGPHGSISYRLGNVGLDSIRHIHPELLPIVDALQAETAPGEAAALTLSLSDYIDVYPLHFWLDLPDTLTRDSHNGEDAVFWSQMAETFRFPVDPNHHISTALTVRRDGQPDTLALSPIPGEGVSLVCHSLLSDSGVWFIPELRREDGTLLDYSKTPGYGVYHLGLPDNQLDMKNFSFVCSLPDDTAVERLTTTPDGSALLLTTRSTKGHSLYLLPLHHPQAQETVRLDSDPATEPWRVIAEDALVVCMGVQGELIFLPKTADGGFHERFKAQLPQDSRFRPVFHDGTCSAMFDGSRLAVALRPLTAGADGRIQPNSFTLLTLEEGAPGVGELTYTGLFSNSLDVDNTLVQDQLLQLQGGLS